MSILKLNSEEKFVEFLELRPFETFEIAWNLAEWSSLHLSADEFSLTVVEPLFHGVTLGSMLDHEPSQLEIDHFHII